LTRSTPTETDPNRKSSENNGAFDESNPPSAQDTQDVDSVHSLAAGSAAKRKVVKAQPRPRPLSGFYGVEFNKPAWRARINYGNKMHLIGSFATKEAAALAYDRETRKRGFDDGFERALNYDTIEEAQSAAAEAEAQLKPVKPKSIRRGELYFSIAKRDQIGKENPDIKSGALTKLVRQKLGAHYTRHIHCLAVLAHRACLHPLTPAGDDRMGHGHDQVVLWYLQDVGEAGHCGQADASGAQVRNDRLHERKE
jgi:hypothetical protein